MLLSTNTIPEMITEGMRTDIKNLAKNMKRIDFSKVTTNDEPVIKRTESIFGGTSDDDMSFIKNNNNSLF